MAEVVTVIVEGLAGDRGQGQRDQRVLSNAFKVTWVIMSGVVPLRTLSRALSSL